MRCPNCRKENTMRSWEGPLKRLGVEVFSRGSRCDSCGEIVFSDEDLGAQEKAVAMKIVERGIRKGPEFKFVRKVAGFKATEIAEMLNVRAETLSRWEGANEVPRTAAFALGELFRHPKTTRERLEAFAR